MRTHCVFGRSVLVGLILSLVSVARAGTLYDNLSAATLDSDSVSSFGPLGDSFSTGAAAVLVDVKILLVGDPTNDGTTSVDLYNDAATSPGTPVAHLGSISDSSLSPTFGPIDVSGFTPVDLIANSRWWIVLTSTDTSAMWGFSPDISGPGVAGEFFSNQFGVFDNSNGPYQMQVNTAGVPEPSTLILSLCGIGTLLVFRRRAAR